MSVVIPVRNERNRLERCLDAVLSQTYPRHLLEIIVVDGHSTDGTREILEKYPTRVLLDGRVSVSEARNRGITAATGEVVAFTDGDCAPHPRWIEAVASRFDLDPSLGGLGGGILMRDRGNFQSWGEGWSSRGLYRGFITSNVAYRRSVLLSVGGFDPALRCGEDWDLWWRVVDAGHRVAFTPEAIVEHDPEENERFLTYLRKQFWYARSDVGTFAKRIRRIRHRARHGLPIGFQESVRIMTPASVQAAGVVALGVAPVLGVGAAVAAGVILGGYAVERTLRLASRCREATPSDLALFGAFLLGRSLVRGPGSIVGLAALAVDARGVPGDAAVVPVPLSPGVAPGAAAIPVGTDGTPVSEASSA